MGAWGVGTFDNDDALDWVIELQNSNNLSPIIMAFSVIDKSSYLEAPDCSRALAAAEVVAALKGNPGNELPDEIVAWLSSNKLSMDSELAVNAKGSAIKIKQSSELKELWEESENLAEWENAINNLILRLKSNESSESEVIPLSFTDWQRKKWYIFVILAGVCSALAQLFISRHSVTIGLIAAYAISYVIYILQDSE